VAFVDPAPDGTAEELYARERERVGYLPNYVRAFSHRPEVYAAWQQLNGAIKSGMELRRYELVTLAAARRLRSSYCALAHGSVLASQFFRPEEVRDIVLERDAPLDEADRAAMAFAEKLVADASSIGEADVERLRAAGLSDADILDVALAAAARCFFSKTLDALGVQPDAEYEDSLEPELREALTVGRPISSRS
jgi:uncharacterized peroxidase-related enzyme